MAFINCLTTPFATQVLDPEGLDLVGTIGAYAADLTAEGIDLLP